MCRSENSYQVSESHLRIPARFHPSPQGCSEPDWRGATLSQPAKKSSTLNTLHRCCVAAAYCLNFLHGRGQDRSKNTLSSRSSQDIGENRARASDCSLSKRNFETRFRICSACPQSR